MNEGGNEVAATVLEELPNALYRVELENKQQVLAHPVGTVKRNFVRLRPGDRVRGGNIAGRFYAGQDSGNERSAES